MKIPFSTIVIVLLIFLVFSGCGTLPTNETVQAVSTSTASSVPTSTSAGSVDETQAVEPSPDNSVEIVDSTTYELAPDTSLNTANPDFSWAVIPDGAKALSDEEIKFFEEYFSNWDNLVFLLSEYSKPEDVDVDKIFYNGVSNSSLSGGNTSDLPEDEQEALRSVDKNADRLDLTKVTTKEANEFLLDKIGLTLDQLSKGFTVFIYLEEYDAYYFTAGDTIHDFITLGPGYIDDNDNIVIFYYAEAVGEYGKVNLHQADNKYYFVSNTRNKK